MDNKTPVPATPPKIKVGIYTFTCCEDSTIMITVLMNKYFFEWKKRIEFVEARVFKKKKSNEPLDVAIVEGAITAEEQAIKLRSIRARAKKLVAIGSCACTGMPSAQRNSFDDKTTAEISVVLNRFQYADKVRKISDIVEVDASVPGCPMNTDLFLKALNELFVAFGHEAVKLI